MAEISRRLFGHAKGGEDVFLYTLENKKGARVGIMNYGATVVSIEVPDRAGVLKMLYLDMTLLKNTLSRPPISARQ